MDANDQLQQDRTPEEVKEMLLLAKLNKEDMLPTSQAVYFTQTNLHNHHYRLLELDAELLDIFTEGKSVRVVGEVDEHVVICTDKKTYNVSEAETTNSLLLSENLKFPEDIEPGAGSNLSKVTVKGLFYKYLELSPSKPHVKKVAQVLVPTAYKGPEHENGVPEERLLTFEELSGKIQASREELKGYLSTVAVAVVDNKLRLLEFEYHFRVLSYMLNLIEENSWCLDEIDYEETVNALSDIVPVEILNGLFQLYAEETKVIDGVQLYRYKEKEVCVFLAKALLRSGGKFNLNEFLHTWQESVPDGMNTGLEMLYGIAIVDKDANPAVIQAFDETILPDNVMERFQVLFGVKDKWTPEEIAPYLESVCTEKKNVSTLLAKYARGFTHQGVKVYTSRYENLY